LLGWGTIDPQMAAYNFTGDSGTIFENGFLADIQSNVTATQAGDISNGCFVIDGNPNVAQVNNSWAISYAVPEFRYPTSSTAGA